MGQIFREGDGPGGGRTRAVTWFSTRGANGAGTPGYDLYLDDVVITDITEAQAAQTSVGELSSIVETQGKTIADSQGKLSALYSIKVETASNGRKVGAGIVLGSNGATSDMIFYADRFSLFNRNNNSAVPVMVAEGNELFIDSARIKNGSITTAKIADRISSNNYAAGKSGWSIAKNGASEFNNVTVRGKIEADSGRLKNVVIDESCEVKGTIYASNIVGDVVEVVSVPANQTVVIPAVGWQRKMFCMPMAGACTFYGKKKGRIKCTVIAAIESKEYSLVSLDLEVFEAATSGGSVVIIPANADVTLQHRQELNNGDLTSIPDVAIIMVTKN